MPDVYQDTDHRYQTDPAFRAVVKMLEQAAIEHGFTPGELKQMAFKAALNIEERRVPPQVSVADMDRSALRGFGIAGHLKDGTPVYYGKEPGPGSTGPRLAVIGPTPRERGTPEPLTIRTREEYKAHFGHYPSSDMFPETAPVTMVPVVDGDPASRLPCPCARCGKEATLLYAFQNTAGTEIYCGYDCYRAAGGEA